MFRHPRGAYPTSSPRHHAKIERQCGRYHTLFSWMEMQCLDVHGSKKTTDVGLEPTASALGGLRATIAPTGQMLLYDKFCFNKIHNLVIKAGSALLGALSQNKGPSGHVPAKFGSLHPFILLQIRRSFAFGSDLRWTEPYEARACSLV